MKTKIITEQQLIKIIKEVTYNIIQEVSESQRRQFNVIQQLSQPVQLNPSTNIPTQHLASDRLSRYNILQNKLNTYGEIVYSFIVDTGHRDGLEIHSITNRAVIIIQNKKTNRIVTFLFARPQQIKRYWEGLNKDVPQNAEMEFILRFAQSHQQRNLNMK